MLGTSIVEVCPSDTVIEVWMRASRTYLVPKMLKVHTDTVSESAAVSVYALMSATRCMNLPSRFTHFSKPKGHT